VFSLANVYCGDSYLASYVANEGYWCLGRRRQCLRGYWDDNDWRAWTE